MTFEYIRARSSFLLAAILAVAAKYCCITTPRPATASADPFDTVPRDRWSSLERHGVTPVEEEKWLQIRALAMWGYFQVLISKVHYLGRSFCVVVVGADRQRTFKRRCCSAHGGCKIAEPRRTLGCYRDPHTASLVAWAYTSQPNPCRLGPRIQQLALSQAGRRTCACMLLIDCMYSFKAPEADCSLTVGFGRPETEGFDPSTIDVGLLESYLEGRCPDLAPYCSIETAACIVAYVELANIARHYSQFVNVTLKINPGSCLGEMKTINQNLDRFAARWTSPRESTAFQTKLNPGSSFVAKLGLASRQIKTLSEHMRLCLHCVLLKPIPHPASLSFLSRVGVEGRSGSDILTRCRAKVSVINNDLLRSRRNIRLSKSFLVSPTMYETNPTQ